MGPDAPFLATIQPLSKARVFLLTGFRLCRQYWRQYWGYIFFGGIFPSKMGRFAPFLATIQALSKTCGFLFNKRSEGCFVSEAPPLVLAPTIFIIARWQLGIDSGSCKS
jgi:hypothetical protein